MPVAALVLLLTAALGHASWNYLAKGARNDLAFSFAFVLCSAVLYLPVAIVTIVVVRPEPDPAALAFVLVSSSLHITYYLLLGEGYRSGDLSLVYPLARGTGPVFAIVGGVVLFSERPTPLALAGAALVIAGIVFMTWSPPGGRASEAGRAIAFALATGACTATYTLWDKEGVSHLTPVLYSYGLDLGRTLFLAPLVLRRSSGRESVVAAFRHDTRAVFGIAILSPLAYILVLAALRLAPVSYVAPAREISILFGAMLGLRLLGESNPVRRLGGAAAIVGGVFALALG